MSQQATKNSNLTMIIGAETTLFGLSTTIEAVRQGDGKKVMSLLVNETVPITQFVPDIPGASILAGDNMQIHDARIEVITADKSASAKQPAPSTYKVLGAMQISDLEVEVEIAFAKGKSGYNYYVKLMFDPADRFDLGKTLDVPFLEGILFTQHSEYGMLGFVLADGAAALTGYRDIVDGLNFYGGLSLADSGNEVFTFIHELLGLEKIDLFVAATDDMFKLEAIIAMDLDIGDAKLTDIRLSVTSNYEPPSTEFALEASLEVDVPDDTLRLTGSIGIQTGPPALANAAFTMQGKWREPLGFTGVVVSDLAMEAGVTTTPPYLTKIGFAGKMEIGQAYMELAFLLNITNPKQSGFVAKGKNLRMAQMINTLTGPSVNIPQSITSVVDQIYLKELDVRIIPQPFSVGEFEFGQDDTGITVLADVSIFGFGAFMFFRSDYDQGIMAYASLSAIDVLGGLIKIGRSEKDSTASEDNDAVKAITRPGLKDYGGPIFALSLTPDSPPKAYLSASVSLFGMKDDVLLIMADDRIKFAMERDLFGLFNARLLVDMKTDFSDVHVLVHLKSDFMQKLRESVTGAIRSVARAATDKINEAQDGIRSAQAELDRLTASWLDSIEGFQKDIRAAKKELAHFDDLIEHEEWLIAVWERQIDDLEWYEIYKAVPLGAKITASYIEIGALKVAQVAATLALEVADLALETFKIVNPLELVLLPARIVLEAANLALEGVELAVGAFAQLLIKIVEYATQFFDIREAMFEGRYSQNPSNPSFVKIKAQIVFMGELLSLEFEIDLRALARGAEALMKMLLEPLGDLDFLGI